MSSVVSMFHDAVDSPEAWPDALKALTDVAEVAGAALIILNKSTGNVDEVCFSGLSAGRKSDYVRHYAAGDPYSPLLDRSWKKLSGSATTASPICISSTRRWSRCRTERSRIRGR